MKKLLPISFLFAIIIFHSAVFAQKEKPLKINFKEGESYHVKMTEILYIRQQSSQVDSQNVDPAWRTTVYNFTETIEKVNPDGTATVASTLDSLTTKIVVDKNIDRNEFFRFNSNNEYDVENRLRDIRALPRAQFLGQTLRYTLGSDGLVKNFQNLSNFQETTIARSFDYDMLHAMMSLADSLRIGQLLEQGFGAIAAFSGSNKGEVHTPYTMTEIHVTRNLEAVKRDNQISFTGNFTDAPDTTQYLEGIAFPMNLQKFMGFTKGSVLMKDGIAINGSSIDTASFELHIEGDIIKEQVSKHLTFEREPIAMLHGGTIKFKELESHHETPKPKYDDDESDQKELIIDANKIFGQDSTARIQPKKK
jgi:hypothetical protein